MPVGIRRAAQAALLGSEGEAFLQRLGQIHELWTHRCNGREHSAYILVQNMSSAFMLLRFLHLKTCNGALHLCLFLFRYGKGWMW